jgi:hypothetical protein
MKAEACCALSGEMHRVFPSFESNETSPARRPGAPVEFAQGVCHKLLLPPPGHLGCRGDGGVLSSSSE